MLFVAVLLISSATAAQPQQRRKPTGRPTTLSAEAGDVIDLRPFIQLDLLNPDARGWCSDDPSIVQVGGAEAKAKRSGRTGLRAWNEEKGWEVVISVRVGRLKPNARLVELKQIKKTAWNMDHGCLVGQMCGPTNRISYGERVEVTVARGVAVKVGDLVATRDGWRIPPLYVDEVVRNRSGLTLRGRLSMESLFVEDEPKKVVPSVRLDAPREPLPNCRTSRK